MSVKLYGASTRVPMGLQILLYAILIQFIAGFVLLGVAPSLGQERSETYSYGVRFRGASRPVYFRPVIGWYIEHALWFEIGMILIAAAWGRWWVEWEKMRCPQCRRSRARRKAEEKVLGIFQKAVEGSKERRMVAHMKYEVRQVCRYCGHEWITTETRRV